MSARTWTLLFFLSLLWGGSFLFFRVAAPEIPPFTLVLARVAIAAAILGVVLRASGHALPRDAAGLRDLFVQGLLNNVVPFVLMAIAQQKIGAGLASILNATTPIFAVTLAHWLAHDKASPMTFAGVALGVVGVAVLVGFEQLAGLANNIPSELAMIGAAFSYGLSSVWSRRFRGKPAIVTATGQLTASSLMLLPLSVLVDRPWTLAEPSLAAMVSVVLLAVLSTAIAYLVFFRIVTVAGPSQAMLVTLLVPPSAILLGWVFLDERLAPQHFAGMAVILSGLLLIDGRVPRLVSARIRGERRRPAE
jgi:drug/metabolite transporter (DMT)-like permease